MYTSISTSFIALTSLLAVTSASPATRQQNPYFAVHDFTFDRAAQWCKYGFAVSFPQAVVISPHSGAGAAITVPGFTDSVRCSDQMNLEFPETYTCGTSADGKQTVTSTIDGRYGILYLNYTYRAHVSGKEQVFLYTGTQTNLYRVDESAGEGFNVAAHGPGVSEERR